MIILYNRSDRLGSNFISKLCQLIYAHKNNKYVLNENEYFNTEITYVKLWNCYQNCLTSLFIDCFSNICDIINVETNDEKLLVDDFFNIDINCVNSHVNLNKIQIDTILNIKQDIFSYFNVNLKKHFYEYLKNKLEDKVNLPNKKYICYHIRLGDISNKTIINESEENIIINYYIDEINDCDKIYNCDYAKINSYFEKFNVKYTKYHDYQSPVSETKVIDNIKKITLDYPSHDIYIITDSPDKISNDVKSLGCKIIKNRNPDFDLWYLIHSDILLTSKSSFSLIAALFHQGSKMYLQPWGLIGSCGLGSKYDKTPGIIDYEFL